MNRTFLLLFLFAGFSFTLHAQSATAKPRKDTIAAGNYYPLDSNVVSCTVSILRNGKCLVEKTITGNRIPLDLQYVIQTSPAGTTIIYDKVTVNDKGVLHRCPSIVYVIGARNTRPGAAPVSKPG